MKKAEAFCRWVDSINEWGGRIVSLAVIPMTLFIVLEVILRYIFSRPTVWVWDVNVQLLGLIAILGAGFTLLHRGHVIMDLFLGRLSPRGRAILDLITSLLFFFSIGIALWNLGLEAETSLATRERANTYFASPLYPLRIAMVIGILMLLLQGIAKFIRDLNIAIGFGEVRRLS